MGTRLAENAKDQVILTLSTCRTNEQPNEKTGNSYKDLRVKIMQRSGTEAIKTQIQPSKPKREITKITNSQNKKGTYGQPNEQLFPKRWPLSNQNRTKNNINTRKVKRHRNSDTKNRQRRTTTKLPSWNGQ